MYMCKYRKKPYIYTVDAIVYNCLQSRKGNYMNKHKWSVELMSGGSLYLIADEVAIYPDGSLVFSSAIDEKQIPSLAIASGQWRLFYLFQFSLTEQSHD